MEVILRLFEIDIIIYDKKEAKIKGDENTDDFPSKACVDLEAVTSFWNNGDNEIVIYLKGGENYCARGITYSMFRNIWEGETIIIPKNECPCCGMEISNGNKCDTCGHVKEAS